MNSPFQNPLSSLYPRSSGSGSWKFPLPHQMPLLPPPAPRTPRHMDIGYPSIQEMFNVSSVQGTKHRAGANPRKVT